MDHRPAGLKVASVAGIPVYIGASWALIAAVLVFLYSPILQSRHPELGARAYAVALVFALLLLVAVLVHEASHAIAARSYGLPVLRIVADLWGGHTAFEAGRSTAGSAAVIAVVGPLSNGALAALAWMALGLTSPDSVLNTVVFGFVLLNAALAGFNLLPGLPLDGGQLVESAVWKATGSRNTGMVVAGWCGRIVTVFVVLWFLVRPLLAGSPLGITDVVWTLFIASFLWAGASSAIRSGQAMGHVARVRLADILRPAVAVRPHDTLDLALGRVTAGQALVVVDGSGSPSAVVAPDAVREVPPHRHAETTLSSVSTPQPRGWSVDADPAGDIVPVIVAMQTLGTTLVAVTHQGRLVGVVTADDINRAVEGR